MNKYVKLFMEDNNLEVNERFELYTIKTQYEHNIHYHFVENGDLYTDTNACPKDIFYYLLNGVYGIIKLPWKPKINERYYFLDKHRGIGYEWYNNQDSIIDKRIIKYGVITKTEEEIIKIRDKQEWREKELEKYWED